MIAKRNARLSSQQPTSSGHHDWCEIHVRELRYALVVFPRRLYRDLTFGSDLDRVGAVPLNGVEVGELGWDDCPGWPAAGVSDVEALSVNNGSEAPLGVKSS
jgi:hypothetical protein